PSTAPASTRAFSRRSTAATSASGSGSAPVRAAGSRSTGCSPAAPPHAPGCAGDRLTGIDGTSVEDRPVTEVVALLRGEGEGDGGTDRTGGSRAARAGTPVRLAVQRDGRGWELTLRRARLATEN